MKLYLACFYHDCGVLFGAAKLLQAKRDTIKVNKTTSFVIYLLLQSLFLELSFSLNIYIYQGTVKLVFQPREEGYAGAYHMLKDDVLDDIDAILSIHVSPSVPSGAIASRPGPILAGVGLFTATIQGKGGHGAAPHETRDPIPAAVLAILSLQ